MAVALEVWGSGELGGAWGDDHMSKKRAWGDDHQKLLEMMLGKPFDDSESGESSRHTLDLLGSASSTSTVDEEQSEFLELGQDVPLPSGWEKRLDLKSGTVFFINLNTGKTSYNDPRDAQAASSCHMSLELLQSEFGKHKQQQQIKKSGRGENESIATNKAWNAVESDESKESSGLDLKLNLSSKQQSSQLPQPASSGLWRSSPKSSSSLKRTSEAAESNSSSTAKVTLTGCKRCLMYVMISQADPRCPKCGSSLVIDFPMPKKPRFNLEL